MKQATTQSREQLRIIARRSLGLLLALLLLFAATDLSQSTAYAEDELVTLQVKGSFIIDSTRQMLDNINDLRANDAWYWNSDNTEKVWATGLAPLEYDYALERMAMQRAAELAVTYAHTRPNGQSCFSAFPSEYSWYTVGENIAYGFTTADSVFTAWAEADELYDGQGHRRNMLNANFTGVGIGCFECEGVLFWAQEFSRPLTHAAAAPLTPPVSVDVLPANIKSARIGQIMLNPGSSVEISSITMYAQDVYSPGLSVPCSVPESALSIADTGIARISGGKIEGLQLGETTLTADLGGLTVSAPIVVSEDSTIPLHLDTPVDVEIPAGETVYFSFTPTETGDYVFSSSGNYDTVGYLYDSNMNQLALNDDGVADNNFHLSYTLEAGTKYYFGAEMYSQTASGSIVVTLEKSSFHTSSGFTYEILDDGTASITACSFGGDITIPETLDGYTVSNLAAKLFYGRSYITSVTIPASVTYFGDNRNDNNWDYVFSYCYELQNIYVDEDNPSFRSIDGVLFSKDGRTLINYPCSHPGEVYHVNAGTLCCTSFASCRNLRFLFLDNPNTTWYTYTFYNTGSLTSFYLKGGYTEQKAQGEIQAGRSFVPADEIVELPEDLQRIETESFRDTAIRYVSVPDGCVRIEAGTFTGDALVYAQVGASTVIEDGAFESSVVIERR